MTPSRSLRSLQPNLDTRQKQLQLWGDIVLTYCRAMRITMLDLVEWGSRGDLFRNDKIRRGILECEGPSKYTLLMKIARWDRIFEHGIHSGDHGRLGVETAGRVRGFRSEPLHHLVASAR